MYIYIYILMRIYFDLPSASGPECLRVGCRAMQPLRKEQASAAALVNVLSFPQYG